MLPNWFHVCSQFSDFVGNGGESAYGENVLEWKDIVPGFVVDGGEGLRVEFDRF